MLKYVVDVTEPLTAVEVEGDTILTGGTTRRFTYELEADAALAVTNAQAFGFTAVYHAVRDRKQVSA